MNNSVLRICSFVTFCQCIVITFAQLTPEQIQVFDDNGVTVTEYDADHWLFEHNGIPDHETGDFPNRDNPNELSEQEHDYIIPKQPNVAAEPGCLPMGTIAAAINGVPFFNPYSAQGYNAVEGDYAEVFDECDGHPQQQGAYHYHAIPDCIFTGGNMELLGVALDGYPIYGPLDSNGIELTSADLDECHGRMVDGQYMYHATRDFPYILGCYHGEVTQSTARGKRQAPPRRPPPTGSGPNDGAGGPGGGMTWSTCIAACENPVLGCDDTGDGTNNEENDTDSTPSEEEDANRDDTGNDDDSDSLGDNEELHEDDVEGASESNESSTLQFHVVNVMLMINILHWLI